MEEYVYGLDFGTSTTLIAMPRDGMPQVLPIGRATNWIPSLIALNHEGSISIGDFAADMPHADQIRSPKTAITRTNNGFVTSPSGKRISADEAILQILMEVNRKAEELGLDVRGRVRMSCPAMWTGVQRRRLAELAQKAGINTDVDSMLDEPVAACVTWWWNNYFSRNIKHTAKVLIFDLGGGTLDVAVADIYGELIPEITVLAARGIDVAGDNLDLKLADYYESRLVTEYHINLIQRDDYPLIQNLAIRAARRVKEGLSYLDVMKFELEDADYSFLPGLEISRLDLEMVYESDLAQALNCVKATLKETFLKNHNHNSLEMQSFQTITHEELAKDIDYVVLAGGMSRIPIIQEKLQKMFPDSIIEPALEGSGITESIVLGVANRNEFEDLNIHRPNFNFIVKWLDQLGNRCERIFYPAFEPLHSDEEIAKGQFLAGYPHRWVPDENPKDLNAHLFLESVGGRRVNLTIHGVQIDHIPLKVFRGQPVQFKIYLDGRIMVTDQFREFSLRVKQWPYIRWHAGRVLDQNLEMEHVGSQPAIDPYDMAWLYDDN